MPTINHLTVDPNFLIWRPGDTHQLDQLIEFGLIKDVERLSLSAQLINRIGQFKFHIVEDEFRLRDPTRGSIYKALHRLEKIDYADLELAEQLMGAIKILQPIERCLNDPNSNLKEAITESLNALQHLKILHTPNLSDYLGKDSYLEDQSHYLQAKLIDLLSKLPIKSIDLQCWLRARMARLINDSTARSEYLSTQKMRLSNFFGIRAGKLHRTLQLAGEILTDYQFDPHHTITQAHQGLFSECSVLDSRLWQDVNPHNLSKAILYIERRAEKEKLFVIKPNDTITSDDFNQRSLIREKMVGVHKTLLDLFRESASVGDFIKSSWAAGVDFLSRIALKFINFINDSFIKGSTIKSLGNNIREGVYYYLDIAPKKVDFSELLMSQAEAFNRSIPNLNSTARYALLGHPLGVIDEGDVLTSGVKFIDSLANIFSEMYLTQPGAALLFTILYALTGGMVMAPQIMIAILTKCHASKEFIGFVYQLSQMTAHAVSGSHFVPTEAIASGSTWGQLGMLGADVAGNGSQCMMIAPFLAELREARQRRELNVPYVLKNLILMGLGAGALLAGGRGLLQIPFLADEGGSIWEISATLLMIKTVGLTWEMMEAKDLSLFGKPKTTPAAKVIIGIFKPAVLILGAVLSPLIGLIKGIVVAYQMPGSAKDRLRSFGSTFMGVVKNAVGRCLGWLTNLCTTLLKAMGKGIKMIPRWLGNLATRTIAVGLAWGGRLMKWVSGGKEGDYQVATRTVLQAKVAIYHHLDNIARFFRNLVIRRFETFYHGKMSDPEAQISAPVATDSTSRILGVVGGPVSEVQKQPAPAPTPHVDGVDGDRQALASNDDDIHVSLRAATR